MKSKKFFALIAAALVLCACLMGCGEDDTDSENGGNNYPSSAQGGTFGVDFGDLLG